MGSIATFDEYEKEKHRNNYKEKQLRHNAKQRERYKKNRDKKLAAQKAYYEKNREQINEQQRKAYMDKHGIRYAASADPEVVDRILVKLRSGIQKTLADPNYTPAPGEFF